MLRILKALTNMLSLILFASLLMERLCTSLTHFPRCMTNTLTISKQVKLGRKASSTLSKAIRVANTTLMAHASIVRASFGARNSSENVLSFSRRAMMLGRLKSSSTWNFQRITLRVQRLVDLISIGCSALQASSSLK